MSMSKGRGLRAGAALALTICAIVFTPGAAGASTPDRAAPTVPTNLHVQALSYTWLTLAWDASTDNSGTVFYDASIDAPVNLTQVRAFDTSQGFGGLEAGTTYTATVRATDLAGNSSAPASVRFTTPARTLPPPTTPTNLHGVYVNGTLTGIAWDASHHSTPVSYVVYSGDSVVSSVSTTSVSVYRLFFVDCAVRLGGTYTFTVQAWAADNYPSVARSAPLTVTIPLTTPTR